MKKIYCLFLFSLNLFSIPAQNYSPIATSGYTLDAVAENTTALATTGGALDGSDFVLYSAAYGAIFSVVGGLPNNGVISSPGYSFQLQPYNQNNMLFLLVNQSNSITVNTPTAYASVSLLGFATEGTGNMNVTLTFTDNTTQTFNNLSLDDWFAGTTSVINGFGRVSRTSGNIANPAGQPKMFSTNLHVSCTNRTKYLQSISVSNVSSNARICIMAAAGSNAPVYTATSSPVSCAGGTNGTASLQIVNSLAPNTYTWGSSPVQFSGTAFNLPSGVYSYTVKDGAGCSFTSTVLVGVSSIPLPPLQVGSSSTLVCPGTPVTLSTFGAVSYTWSTGANSAVSSVTPNFATTYSVSGTTAANCIVNGSISIQTHSLLSISFAPIPNSFCVNSQNFTLSAMPGGGSYTGPGVTGNLFSPSLSGSGNFTINYVFFDGNGCMIVESQSTSVHALPQISFSVSPSTFCRNSPTLALSANPMGGIFFGNGVIGSVFSPTLHAVGSSSLTYYFTDANNCTDTAKVGIVVNDLPQINFTAPPANICIKAANLALSANPSGGQFSGNGVQASAFSPSLAGLGTHVVSYSYTLSSTNCSDIKSHSITVSACAELPENLNSGIHSLLIYPNPASAFLEVKGFTEGKIFLFNSVGQLVSERELLSSNGYHLHMDRLSEGVYSLVHVSRGQQKVYKVLVTN